MIERVRRDLVRGPEEAGERSPWVDAATDPARAGSHAVKNWDYRELRERIADGLMLRRFANFYCDPVPKHDAFGRGFNRLTPETLKAINDLVVQAAVDLGLEDGMKLRVDTTVVQTDIHHPTDNTLLWDVVRVVAPVRPGSPARFVTALSTSISPHPHLRVTIQSLATTLPFRSNPSAQSPAHRTYRSLKRQMNPRL